MHTGIPGFRSQLITEQGYQIMRLLEIWVLMQPTMLGRWKREFEGGVDGSPDSTNGKVLQVELTRLRKENHCLKMEREILKKAAAFFANESGCGIK